MMSTLGLDVLRLGIWLVLLLAVFVPLERLWPLHSRRTVRKAFYLDILYYFVSGLVPKLLLILPLSLVAAGIHRFAPAGYYQWAATLPLGVRIVGALIVGEIGSYWAHRWSHESAFLWRFHAVHHSAEEIDWLVNSRAHPLDMVFTRFCGLFPMYALGLAQPMGGRLDWTPLLITILGAAWGFFIHANLKWRLGWLEWLVSSPAFHHWHHTNDGPEVLNKNYAAMLPWVDRMFGTFHLPQERWPERYGTDSPVAPTFTGQLLLRPGETSGRV
jgi:sterol desaturase/sphingolipid hydroxylase (fatty acid hydroxylase superfamily)